MDKLMAEKSLIENIDWVRNFSKYFDGVLNWGNYMWDYDDICQDVSMEFLRACETFDETKGASLRTYAARVIRNRLQSKLKDKGIHPESKNGTFYVSMQEDVNDRKGQVETAAMNELYEKVLFEEVYEELGKIYRREKAKTIKYGILAIYGELEGFDLKGVADALGVTTRYLSVCRARAREKVYDTPVIALINDLLS